jgi:hypothetical protein
MTKGMIIRLPLPSGVGWGVGARQGAQIARRELLIDPSLPRRRESIFINHGLIHVPVDDTSLGGSKLSVSQ